MHDDQPREQHRVAVLRVDVRGSPPRDLIVMVVEVGRRRGDDRVLGTASTPERVAEILRDWLEALTAG
ncbi:hypothetical protein [Actinoplanes auranticolor]|uniref:Uncharacterized protein n=1 Tax=Actinoplanes auranticolor TaxID=47988 RepID=A0A919SRT3_9ACTN|nr:hypothetical protein [Actinoplanes auranticolor]GIM76369.1 hypothetical protein Aau02nite_70510 [Actinoplanes auranticolor]